MDKYAMVKDGLVIEVVTKEAFDTFNETVQALFVPCPNNVEVHYTFVKGKWIPPK